MTPDEARTLIRYSGWASRKVLAAARELSQEQLETPNGVSHGSIAGTLAHIYLADRVWCERVMTPGLPVTWDATLDQAEADWPRIQKAWEDWSDAAGDADLARVVEYKSILLNSVNHTAASDIVTHVVNHATLHRGQVVGMIRQLGVKPPTTDFIFYLRERNA